MREQDVAYSGKANHLAGVSVACCMNFMCRQIDSLFENEYTDVKERCREIRLCLTWI